MCSALRIDGTFDDCQRLVKEAFSDPALSRRHRFSSANSINIGRLLPQMVYYIASSLDVAARTGMKAVLHHSGRQSRQCIARRCGRAPWAFRIARIILAHNINRTVPDFLATGEWQPRPSIATLASAMDVGNPSNMERIRALYPSWDAMREHLSADSVDDATIRARIGEDFMQYGREWCPHTATAAEVYSRLSAAERRDGPWVIVATAHPAKFNDIVEPIIKRPVAVPDSLAQLLAPAAALHRPARRRLRHWPQHLMTSLGIDPQWIGIGAALLFLGAASFFGLRAFRRRSRRRSLLARLERIAFGAAHQVLVPDGMGGFIHIDHLLLTPRGVLVLDTRRVAGLIFGGDQMSDWTVMGRGNRYTFDNPQPALYDRIAAPTWTNRMKRAASSAMPSAGPPPCPSSTRPAWANSPLTGPSGNTASISGWLEIEGK